VARKLILYTDGITEAQYAQGMLYGKERLLEAAQAEAGSSAQNVQAALLARVREFVGDAPVAGRDDIAVIVVMEDE
jgi:sigma-B regulation protein RsbU (phosphoserine phosphatase)